jgi:signal transduction histidine kinase
VRPEDLSHIAQLQGVPDTELLWFADHCEPCTLKAGELFFTQGEEVRYLVVILMGKLEVIRREGSLETSSFTIDENEITGLLPFSRMTHYGGTGRALVPTRLALFDATLFPELHRHAPAILQRLINVMVNRAREFTRMNEQQERLISLGTMAAGLAHELNNPASAARRAAQNLTDTLQAFNEHASTVLSTYLFRDTPPADENPLTALYSAMTLEPTTRNALKQGELEDDLADWLEAQDVPQPFDAAAILIAVGLTRELVEAFAQRLRPEETRNVLAWLTQDAEMRLLARDLAASTARISELVRAMKAYSYMDQGLVKASTDLHKGLEDTLIILGHKLKAKNVQIMRDYGDVPPVLAFGAELNQVWTNLIDNAIAAVTDGGTVTLCTRLDQDSGTVSVNIIDDGSGIAPDVLTRIFEPFFTTKGVGEGTGLGLDIAHRIVTRRHGGSIRAVSQPGETRFTVRLPL